MNLNKIIIFKPVVNENEIIDRKIKYLQIILNERLDWIKSRSTINTDGSLDVDGNVWLDELELTEIPLKFNKINGSFDCACNQLTNLKNCPNEVNGYFNCSYNQLTSLEGCPKEVGKNFYCYGNKVKFTEEDVRKHCNAKINMFRFIDN